MFFLNFGLKFKIDAWLLKSTCGYLSFLFFCICLTCATDFSQENQGSPTAFFHNFYNKSCCQKKFVQDATETYKLWQTLAIFIYFIFWNDDQMRPTSKWEKFVENTVKNLLSDEALHKITRMITYNLWKLFILLYKVYMSVA